MRYTINIRDEYNKPTGHTKNISVIGFVSIAHSVLAIYVSDGGLRTINIEEITVEVDSGLGDKTRTVGHAGNGQPSDSVQKSTPRVRR